MAEPSMSLNVRIPVELYRRLEEHRRAAHLTKTEVVQAALDAYLAGDD